MGMRELAKIATSSGYPVEAFLFVQRGLDFTVRRTHGELSTEEQLQHAENAEGDFSRHVSGEQLSWGLRDYAIEQYGLLAKTVLKRWNIRASEDFGKIVFAMVNGGLMLKTDDDTIEDFRGVFEFDDAFNPDSIGLGAVG